MQREAYGELSSMKNNTELPFLYTIGYEGRTLNEFVGQLKEFDISILVDVRENPFSRKKGFSKTPLSQYLKEYDIEYLHLKTLGSPKPLRQKLRLDGNYDYFFEEYSKYIKSQMRIIEELYRIILTKICCIMCYEREPQDCHRFIVAQEIKRWDGNGLTIKHIKKMA